MDTAGVLGVLGGLAAAVSVVGVLVRISWQLGGFQAELRDWRIRTDARLDQLEAARGPFTQAVVADYPGPVSQVVRQGPGPARPAWPPSPGGDGGRPWPAGAGIPSR